VANITHHLSAEIATDGALRSHFRIGRSEEFTDAGNDVIAYEDGNDDRTGGHEGLDFRVERLFSDVSVMLAKLGRSEAGHLAGLDFETGGFEAGEDGAAQTAFHAVWLKDDKSLFHWVPLVLKGRSVFDFKA
jgi:hypothetical protein